MVYNVLILVMLFMAVVVFVALFFFKAGYGYLSGGKWGPEISNKTAWVLMEAPAFAVMTYMVAANIASGCTRGNSVAIYVIAGLYLLHYFQRSFIFPMLMRGKSRMPVAIMLMGVTFNSINAWLLGQWLFFRCPEGFYYDGWLTSPQFIIGSLIFFAGMFINMQSDYIIRHLRKPGDTKHYIPREGMYKYVTSANYLGEIIEWIGYAVLSASPAAVLFVIWTFANLAPRSKTLTEKYVAEFGDEYTDLHKKNLIPFIW